MNANEIADGLAQMYIEKDVNGLFNKRIQNMLRQQQQLIENLNGRIERMIEKQSHYESMAHAGGFEAGRELGMKQERALWELAASTQEIQQQAETGFYKQDADKYKLKCENQQAEIDVLRMMLANRNDIIDKLDLK